MLGTLIGAFDTIIVLLKNQSAEVNKLSAEVKKLSTDVETLKEQKKE